MCVHASVLLAYMKGIFMPPSQLSQALIAARKDVHGTVFKAGRNDAQKFTYVGHEHVIEHVRAALLKHGLDYLQTSCVRVGESKHQASRGEMTMLHWEARARITHAESGETLEIGPIEGTTQTGDKVAYVASTSLDRTILLRLFNLAGSREENVEDNSHPDINAQAPQGNGNAQAQAPQKRPSQPSRAKERFKGLMDPLGRDFGVDWKLAYAHASKALKLTCGLTECTDEQLNAVCDYLEQLGAALTAAGKLGDDYELSRAADVADWKRLDLAGATALIAKMEGGQP